MEKLLKRLLIRKSRKNKKNDAPEVTAGAKNLHVNTVVMSIFTALHEKNYFPKPRPKLRLTTILFYYTDPGSVLWFMTSKR